MAEKSDDGKSCNAQSRKSINLKVALRAIKAGVPVLALGRGKVPIVQAFPRLDTSIPADERDAIRARFVAEHDGREPLGIGSSTNESRVRAWSRNTGPDFAVGISPGLVGAVVIDCDDFGGMAFRRFLEQHDEPLDYERTPIIVTGSGGIHAWFANPEGIGCGKLKALHADVKGVGGQVVAPGCTLAPKVGEDGKPVGTDRTYQQLERTPDLFATIAAGLLPPLPACIRELKSEAPEATDSDADVTAALGTLAAWLPDNETEREALAMVAEVAAADDGFRKLWEAPGPDTSTNRWQAARTMLQHLGPARYTVAHHAAMLAEWDGAGVWVERAGERGTYDDRGIAREWAKNRDAPRVATGAGLALPTVEDALAAVEEAVTLGLDLDVAAEGLRVAMTNHDAPQDRTAAAMQAVERLKAGGGAMEQLDRIVREHGTVVEVPAVETAAPAKPPRFRFETAADLEAEADVDSVFIVDDLIEAGTLFVLYGNPGCGKSAIILDMLLRVAHGLPWAGRATTRTGVLYLSPEGPKGLKRRFRAWHTLMREQGHVVGGAPFEVLRQQVDLFGSDVGINAIAEQVRTFKRRHGIACGFVVVDTLRQALVGGDENSARDIGTFTQKLTALRDAYGVVCGIVHHDGKDASRGAAGSTAIVGNVDIELAVEKPKGSRSGTIRAGKMRDGFLDGKVPYELKSGVGEIRQDGTTKSAVVAVVGGSNATSSLGAVEDEAEEAADLGAPVEVVEADPDSDDARDAMMMQAARSLGQAFSRRDLYAAVRNLRTVAKLDRADISDTRLDAVRMRLQLRGDIVREGEGKSSRWVAGTE